MQTNGYDPNFLLIKIQILDVLTTDLRSDALIISVENLEIRWGDMLEKMQECFSYANLHQVYLGEHKNELRHIIENLHSVEKALKERKSNPPKRSDTVAEKVISIADKVDKILVNFGWRPVVRPITEAIFHIPRKLKEIFSPEEPRLPPPSSPDIYMPSSLNQLTSKDVKTLSATNTVIDGEASDIEEKPETSAEAIFRRLRTRIDKRLSGENIDE